MIRPMKWHIFQKGTDYPLVWDDKVIEFDTEEEAQRFANDYFNEEELTNIYIKECIFYYDGGYITALEVKRIRKD